MSDCKQSTIDSNVVGLAYARETCPSELPSGVKGDFVFGPTIADPDLSRFENTYNSCEKELKVFINLESTADPTLKVRVMRARGPVANIGVATFVGGHKNWNVVEDATAAARWDRLNAHSEAQTVATLISIDGEVEDGDVFTIEASSDDFATVLSQTLTVTIDGTGEVRWNEIAYSEDNDTGTETTLQERATKTSDRQNQKGGVIDNESVVGYTMEVTNSTFDDFVQGFMFAQTHEQPATEMFSKDGKLEITSVGADVLVVSDSSMLPVNSLVRLQGLNGSNNGLKLVTATPSPTDVTMDLAAEVSIDDIVAHRVGFQAPVGDLRMVVSGALVEIISLVTDFTTKDLNLGQWLFVGGDAAETRFDQGFGIVRIHKIEQNKLTVRQVRWASIKSEVAIAKTIQIFVCDFTRNEQDPTLIKRYSYQFERILGSDQIGIQSEYLKGQHPNELQITTSAAEAMTAEFGFIGLGSEYRNGAEGLKAGVRVTGKPEDSLNSADHIKEQIVYIHDNNRLQPNELVGGVKDSTISINNNATYAKRVGKLGGFSINHGNFDCTLELTTYFTTVAALQAIEAGADVGYNQFIAFDNEGMVFDYPLMSIAGKPDTSNESIELPLDCRAAKCEYGYTMSHSRFHYLPNIAMVPTDD